MYTPSFVKIPDDGLKIPQTLVELTWNDPYIQIVMKVIFFICKLKQEICYFAVNMMRSEVIRIL